ncbi:glycosyl hydrolase [Paenibacillus pinistramenti]|uniref:glycosyl hydrolase n=1 Tax=Paenibacillus pinistramenti TaxID=1768003 RepID=UPI0011086876|nr:glycosyl hydrolase [Paenibacillus pinistramenti]
MNYRMFRIVRRVLSIVLPLCFVLASGSAAPASAVSAANPIDPGATAEAKQLLNTLYTVTGKNIISGQHDYLESPDEINNKLNRISTQYAALHGYELGPIMGQTAAQIAEQRKNVVNSAINWYRAGGIVTMTFHEALPGTAPVWSNVQKSVSQADFDKYVTPGTPQYNSLIADLDSVAASLETLRDAGVPVLWRPYHEMNGDWFWWGKKSNFSALWNLMYDRFVNVHHLDNLIWVWCPNAPTSSNYTYGDYFPGLSKVDVLALDIYNNDFRQSYYDNLLKLAQGKPIAIGENGEMPSPSLLSASQQNWAYFMTWGSMLTQNNSNDTIYSYMNSSYYLTRAEFSLISKIAGSPVTAPLVNGLYGEYFPNLNLSGVPLTRTDAKLDFNWRSGSPGMSVPNDNFSVRWTGQIQPRYSETYTFSTLSDDGIRVWVNGTLIIDSWIKQSWTERRGSIALTAGQLYDIKIEYYEGQGDSMVKLMWQSASQTKETVPAEVLFQPGALQN